MAFRSRGLPLLFLILAYPCLALSFGAETERTSLIEIVALGPERVEIEVTCGSIANMALTGDSLSTFSVTIPGFDQDCTPFGPCLPVKGFAVGIPVDADPAVTIIEKSSYDLKIPSGWPSSLGSSEIQSPVEIGLVGFIRDLKVAQILIHPVAYLPETKTLRVYDHIRFVVRFKSNYAGPIDGLGTQDPLDRLLYSLVINPEQSSKYKVRRQRDNRQSNLLAGGTERYKILVQEEGIYRITGSELEAAGMEIEWVDPRMIHLENLGQPVPLYVHGDADGKLDEDDYLEFYGEGPRGDYTYFNMYATSNVYWLFVGDSLGLPMIEEDGGLLETDPAQLEMPTSYDFDVHTEVDNWFERLPNDTMVQQDMWFWDMVSASEQAIKDFPLDLPDPDLGSGDTVVVKLGLQGMSHHGDVNPDHHCLFYLSGALAGGTYWDGQHTHVFSSEEEGTGLENTVLSESGNKLTIVMPGDTPAGFEDRVLVNWIEISYTRQYKAENDYIRFSKPRNGSIGLYQFTIEGFTTPEVSIYKLGKSKLANLSIEPVILFGDTSYQAAFQTRIVSEGVEFVAVAESRKKKVVSLEKDQPSDLHSSLNGADIIVVVHDSLAVSAEEYETFRESQGYRVELVNVSDVYDEFSYGIRDASAIRDFLRYAYLNWIPPAPSMCVLIGDGSSDDRDLNKRGGNLIPVHVERSIYSGLVASDNWYACIIGDDFLPDMIVSRFPVLTRQELSSVIEKLKRHEDRSTVGAWRGRVLCAAGEGGGFGVRFRELMEDSIAKIYLPIWADGKRVYAEHLPGVDPDPFYGDKGDLFGFLNDGVSVVQYLGHGSGGTWSNPYLLTPQDVPDLDNTGKIPVVASFTCFTSVFDQPSRQGLGEALFLEPEGGAVAVIGATSLGYFWEDVDLARSFNQTMVEDSTRTVGSLFYGSKLNYAFSNYGGYAATMIKCYCMLGDPASRFSLPVREVEVGVYPRSVGKGDSVRLELRLTSQKPDSAFVCVSDSAGTFGETVIPLAGGQGAISFEVPMGVKSGMALARAYAWDTESAFDALGAAEFAISSPSIYLVKTIPQKPGPWDSVHVMACIQYSPGIDSANTYWARSRSPQNWNTIGMTAIAGDTFQTSSPIPQQTPDKPVCYKVVAYGSDGKTLESALYSYQVPDRPNLLLLSEEDIYLGGERRVTLSAKVFNTGSVEVDSCPVLFKTLPDSLSIGEGWASVPVLGYGEASVPWSLGGLLWSVYVEIDPGNEIDESREDDNSSINSPTTIIVDRFNVSKESGTSGWVSSIDSNLVCSIPSDAVSDSVVLQIQVVEPHVMEQPSLRFAALPGFKSGGAYKLSLADSSDTLLSGKEMVLKMRFDSEDSLNNEELDLMGIYAFNPLTLKWKKYGGQIDSSEMSLQARKLREYAVITSGDVQPPEIKVSVKDQAFASGDFVPASPAISFLLIDDNGIDMEKGLLLVLDGEDVGIADYVYPGIFGDANEVQVGFYPHLTDGPHTIRVGCWDCSGNFRSLDFAVQVQSEFQVTGLGNYPNPVESRETVFAFTMTAVADEAELRIYTPSGRLVKSFDRGRWRDLKEIGYHEVVWNLTDEDWFPVANGLYFYMFRAKIENKTIKETGKLAVLR
ncbi:hypothetical protein E3J62_03720 [candidate division TA06 bacterium]|uniref:Gingipain domain-containing protein n=1 Tax=candidate division TA06 bacterium TaxID=2250710 RepID=A0A523UW64_UNCT6|nr:MAG: hypothetical protein E3J62_03720 [candidate division TA06 bacterium]